MPRLDPGRSVPATQLFMPYAKLNVETVRRKFRRLLRLVGRDTFTEKQLRILACWESRLTQTQTASRLGICQTSVCKHWFGNLIYNGPYIGSRHGGILTKVEKHLLREGLDHEWDEFSQLTGLN